MRLATRLVMFLLFAALWYVLLLTFTPQRLAFRTARNLNVPSGGYGHQWTRSQEVARYGAVDVLFVGSSHAYRGFDPRIWSARGYRTFNLGSSSQTPLQSEVLLQRHLAGLRPSLVILELGPTSFSYDGVESALDVLANAPADGLAWQMALHTSHLKVWNSMLYTWAHRGVFGMPDIHEPQQKGSDTYIPGGYVEKKLRHYKHAPPERPTHFTARPEQVAALDRMLALLKAEGVRTIAVEAPVTRSRRASAVDQDQFAEWITAKLPYFDLQGRVPLDDSLHFYDAHHLNQLGVDRMNGVLIDLLEAEGVLTPRP